MSPAQALDLLVPGDPARRTGGSLYDARIADGLRAAGWTVRVHGLHGDYPVADGTARRALDHALASVPDGGRAVIDGLALGGLPEVAETHAARIELIALIHHPLCDETGLDWALARRLLGHERRAVAACRRIITTSRFTAKRLRELAIGSAPVTVVEPGTDPAALARGALGDPGVDEPVQLLSVGSLVPRKGQDLLIDALIRLGDSSDTPADSERIGRGWTCRLIGAPRDPEFADRLRARIAGAGLGARILLAGEADADALDRAYREADLFVLPSRYEGYGMVVTEALARGLPIVSTTGGALAETVPDDAGLKVAPNDAGALADALERWFGDAGLRERLAAGARRARGELLDWPGAAERFGRAVSRR